MKRRRLPFHSQEDAQILLQLAGALRDAYRQLSTSAKRSALGKSIRYSQERCKRAALRGLEHSNGLTI